MNTFLNILAIISIIVSGILIYQSIKFRIECRRFRDKWLKK